MYIQTITFSHFSSTAGWPGPTCWCTRTTRGDIRAPFPQNKTEKSIFNNRGLGDPGSGSCELQLDGRWRREEDGAECVKTHSYYQWVPYVLMLQVGYKKLLVSRYMALPRLCAQIQSKELLFRFLDVLVLPQEKRTTRTGSLEKTSNLFALQ